jgi:hypothetical protein
MRFWIERPMTLSGRIRVGAADVEGRVRVQVGRLRSAAVVALREARCGLGVDRRQRWVPSSKSLDATVAAPSSVSQRRSGLDLRVSVPRADARLVSTMCCERALQALFAYSAAQAGCCVGQVVESWARRVGVKSVV